ncbi:2-C-methyl-D-erythritol 4-phosphate cytidylyltransferase [Malacoplasma penetrans]|uniref:Cytidine diphosphocholine pyrophosphorylase n=1 Tax=Malacoplasma penetrans (strain HF-2) TaxID=272633 RepID=Q8EWC7_MALP2|nr:IspD/TarI family cytidylyltransferase [Malacoplasma penetrans]RXY96762.1 2-C-methyl-D-erythritol 4-phosphate cytidylyltransferase [Malacoplasma penetrans]BAC44069.1 cytidine diphosphocholine pyrophosphorylase [Malacoplasma penetrans HF-2]
MKNNQVYAILLAAGSGSRVNSNIPKQYIDLNGLPLFFYSLKTFANFDLIDKVVLVVNHSYKYDVESLIKKYEWKNKVFIVNGGDTRHLSIINAVKFLKSIKINSDDIVLTHDCARPFVSTDIIKNNIDYINSSRCDVVSTGIVPEDTIGITDNSNLEKILNRQKLFIEQTPQSAKYKIFEEVYFGSNLSDKTLETSTDFCSLALLCNKDVKCVIGNKFNFKVTTDFDLVVAKEIIKNKQL